MAFFNRVGKDVAEKLEAFEMLRNSAGVGLFDALIHDGDAMSPKSVWNWSTEFRRLCGYAPEDHFPNVAQSWTDRIHPDDLAQTMTDVAVCLQAGSSYDLVYRMKTKSGAYRWFRATGSIALDAQGRPRRSCGALVDIQANKDAEDDRRKARETLAQKFETAIAHLVDGVTAAAGQLQTRAQTMAATAEETSLRSTTVSAASEEATQNVNTVAAATEELSASVREIARQVEHSTRMSGAAVSQARDTNVQIQGLAVAVEKIGAVVKLINDIASQTNLLALNATIEAARAGDAGKGFAVVASEVKALAGQTAKATEEISAQITTIQEATAASVTAIQTIAGTITQVNETAAAIASSVEEQGTATREIAVNVAEAARGTAEVTANISGVSAAAHQTGVTAKEMLVAAGDLSSSGETLKRQVDQFLSEVRTA